MVLICQVLNAKKVHSEPPLSICRRDQPKRLSMAQNKEGILPVATLSIALYVLRRSMSARGDDFFIGFININKYTSASENVHLSLRTVNWVTLVSLLVEYLLYSVAMVCK